LRLDGLVPLARDARGYAEFLEVLKSRSADAGSPVAVTILEAARPFLVAALRSDLGRPMLVVTSRRNRARQIYEQLKTWSAAPDDLLLFPEPDVLSYERVPWDRGIAQDRLATLTRLATSDHSAPVGPLVVVASVRALLQKTVPRKRFVASLHELQVGQTMSRAQLLDTLHGLGYERVTVVEEPGTYSARGGIVDFYSAQNERPMRIELFGDEVESLRFFDPATQRSVETAESIGVVPAREAFPLGFDVGDGIDRLDLTSCHPEAAREFEQDLEALRSGDVFDTSEFYLPYLYAEPGTLLDYLQPGALVVLEDPLGLEATVTNLQIQNAGLRHDLVQKGELPKGVQPPHFTWGGLARQFEQYARLEFRYDVESELEINEGFIAGTPYAGRLQDVIARSVEMTEQQWRVVVVSRQTPRLTDLYEDWGLTVQPAEEIQETPAEGSLTLLQGSMASGWQMLRTDGRRMVLLTDGEIFGWVKPEPRRPHRSKPLPPEAFFSDIEAGDYVVHLEHGIGIFQGLVHLDVDQANREYLQVDYAEGDRLYVPTYQGDRLSRYVGAKAEPPRIDRLGTGHWSRVKQSAKQAVEEMAKELLDLYSLREVVEGHAFSTDTPWQSELDASFPYAETEDQLRAIQEVKKDMERPRPMDRLVCGDVGYGKTEVALRAAFKAVMDNKQVGLLVPTTVLAQQHYRTFKERLSAFPIEVEMLSRFRTRGEQEQVLQRLSQGAVDIIIGTHRLLQKDVVFKDLGLLIIDEEQRFGVSHKERLKQMRSEVDVLTLTATPIPRTLYLSLAGARDMNTIDTPPEYRLPVVTRVSAYDEALIRRAILREMDRGGQTYFVHNRVRGIQHIANRLRRLLPEADIVVAHGQMEEAKLAEVMNNFAAGAHDVLVCTTIIESGIDIPNANTLIVNRADRFGLAQLYQLRGRVGRSTLRAYAYLLYDEDAPLSDEARQRLQTIKEASELGAGFRIAMRDLEMRGGGDVLGTRQHGHISAVGFDLYCRLLARAIQDLRARQTKTSEEALASLATSVSVSPDEAGPTIGLPLDALLPEEYVPEHGLRLGIYRRMAGLTSLEEIDQIREEIEDRFGELPEEAENLIYMLRVKVLASAAGVATVSTENSNLVIGLGTVAEVKRRRAEGRLPQDVRVVDDRLRLSASLRDQDWQRRLEETLRFMAGPPSRR
jgi:transcription-repair coupling factor (superfamily II helicase)